VPRKEESRTGAKVAFGLGAVGLLAGIFWGIKKARAAESDAERYRGEANAASKRAGDATAAARAAAGRESAALDAAGRERAAAQFARQQAEAAGAAAASANAAAASAQTAASQAAAREAAARAAQASSEANARAAEAKVRADAATAAAAQAADEKARAALAAQQQANAASANAAAAAAADAALERKRQIVASGFQSVLAAVKRKSPRISQQEAVNRAAAFMRTRGVLLDKPDPTLAFWRQDENALLALVTAAVNTYLTLPAAAQQTPGIQPVKATATVTTIVDPAKAKLVEDAWAYAVGYAIQQYKDKKKKTLTPAQAFALVAPTFTTASALAPGAAPAPPPSALKSPSAYWANPLAIVKMSTDAAGDAVTREIDYRTSDPALAGWRGSHVSVI